MKAVGLTAVQMDADGTVRLERPGREAPEEPVPLLRKPPGGVRLGHLSDFHLGKPLEGAPVPERVERWLETLAEAGTDLVVVSGDLIEEPGVRIDLLRMRRCLERGGLPWVVVPGNHDVAEPGRAGPFGELFGRYPRVERHAGVDVVLLDSFGGYPVEERTPFERLQAAEMGSYSRGRVGRGQLERAEAQLAGSSGEHARPRILVVHHHLAAERDVTGESHHEDLPTDMMVPTLDAPEVLRWARRMGIRAAFHGHIHRFWPPYVRRNVVVLNSGSSTRGRPVPRARLVDLDGDGEVARIWDMEKARR